MILPEWRDRGHFISLLYRCRLTSELALARRFDPESPLPDQWAWHETCPIDMFVEHQAYSAYLG